MADSQTSRSPTSTGNVSGGRGPLGRRDALLDHAPSGNELRQRPADHVLRGHAERPLARRVDEADTTVVVDEDDAVADGGEHPRRLLALRGDRLGRLRGRLRATALLVQARGAHRCGHLADERLDELHVLARVGLPVVHDLDDTYDAALVLDGNHDRGANLRLSGLGDLPHLAAGVDVVVRPLA